MYLAVGVVLSAANVLLFAWGFAQHRRAQPARWTRFDGLSSGFTIIIVALAPAAIGALTMAVIDPLATFASLDVWNVGAIVVAVALAVRLTPRFIREGRTGGSGDVVIFPVSPGGAPLKPMKRAA